MSELQLFQFYDHCLSPTGTQWRAFLHLLANPIHSGRLPQSYPFSRLNMSYSLSLSSMGKCLKPLSLWWFLTGLIPVSFWTSGSQAWTLDTVQKTVSNECKVKGNNQSTCYAHVNTALTICCKLFFPSGHISDSCLTRTFRCIFFFLCVCIYFLSVVYTHSYRSHKLYLTRNIPGIWFHHSRDHEISSPIATGNIICTSKNLVSEGHHKTDYKIHTTNISHHSYLPCPAEIISSADIARNLLTDKPSLNSWFLIPDS